MGNVTCTKWILAVYGCLAVTIACGAPAADGVDFSMGLIEPITLTCPGHESSVKNGVKFDVFYQPGVKNSVAVYAINTGRKQLVLTPDRHRAILEELLKKQFTVVVADFRDKKLPGVELEKYAVQLTADAQAAADGVVRRTPTAKAGTSRTETFANDFYILMPGFTVEREVTWFRYGQVPEAIRKAIAQRVGKPFQEADAQAVNTYDIVYPVYGPSVGVLTNYGSNEKGREDYYARDAAFLVMAFAFKNLAIVHQQYFNDPVGGYHKGYDYYGDQFAACFIRHIKGSAGRYHLDPERICCFGHSKGSETPGMLVNRLRGQPPYLYGKIEYAKLGLNDQEKTIPSDYADLSTDITCAILGAGIANREMAREVMMPWRDNPVKNISPFFIYADHRADTRSYTAALIEVARTHGVTFETAEHSAHFWPIGESYDRASAFIDRHLKLDY